MDLSKAIRLGSVGKRKIKDKLFDLTDGMCALGAAALAVGVVWPYEADWSKLFPFAFNRKVRCPYCGNKHSLISIVFHLNDSTNMPFSQIADFVESVELDKLERRPVEASCVEDCVGAEI